MTNIRNIENTVKSLVVVRPIMTDIGNFYRMEIAGIPIRAYLSDIEADRTALFMRKVVRIMIQSPQNAKVIIQQISTEFGEIYRMVISGMPIRAYLSKEDADEKALFMEKVVQTVIVQSGEC